MTTSAGGFEPGPKNVPRWSSVLVSEQEIRSALEKEVEAERWTNLDRALRNATDDGAGIANLRPRTSENDPELRRLMVGRVAKLERLGLAEQIEPGCWTLKPGLEDTLRDLSIRGDVIKTMHRAMSVIPVRAGCLRLCPARRRTDRCGPRPPRRPRVT